MTGHPCVSLLPRGEGGGQSPPDEGSGRRDVGSPKPSITLDQALTWSDALICRLRRHLLPKGEGTQWVRLWSGPLDVWRHGRNLAGLAAALLLLALWIGAAFAQSFPALTGRVVDAAHVLSPITMADLERKLADLEQKSGIQLVVATVPSLGGQEIEPYANSLFRTWKLGETKKDNGALLLIAPNERRVRIEVGYGLEGTLTDAVSSLIIRNAIAPRFKAGDFNGGVTRGVDDIITALTTDAAEWQPKQPDTRAERDPSLFEALAPFLVFLFIMFVFSRLARRNRGNVIVVPMGWGGGRGGGFGGGGFGGGGFGGGSGGFSGGGGSSGGGGASGGW